MSETRPHRDGQRDCGRCVPRRMGRARAGDHRDARATHIHGATRANPPRCVRRARRPRFERPGRMRRLLLVGSAEEPLIAEAFAGRDANGLTPPTVVLLPDVWAKNQIVTVALLPDTAQADALAPLLPRIRDAFLRQFDEHIRRGMAVIPTNEWLAERLRRVTGATLAVPQTYMPEQLDTDVFVFRQEEQGFTPVARTITIDSRARDAIDWSPDLRDRTPASHDALRPRSSRSFLWPSRTPFLGTCRALDANRDPNSTLSCVNSCVCRIARPPRRSKASRSRRCPSLIRRAWHPPLNARTNPETGHPEAERDDDGKRPSLAPRTGRV